VVKYKKQIAGTVKNKMKENEKMNHREHRENNNNSNA